MAALLPFLFDDFSYFLDQDGSQIFNVDSNPRIARERFQMDGLGRSKLVVTDTYIFTQPIDLMSALHTVSHRLSG